MQRWSAFLRYAPQGHVTLPLASSCKYVCSTEVGQVGGNPSHAPLSNAVRTPPGLQLCVLPARLPAMGSTVVAAAADSADALGAAGRSRAQQAAGAAAGAGGTAQAAAEAAEAGAAAEASEATQPYSAEEIARVGAVLISGEAEEAEVEEESEAEEEETQQSRAAAARREAAALAPSLCQREGQAGAASRCPCTQGVCAHPCPPFDAICFLSLVDAGGGALVGMISTVAACCRRRLAQAKRPLLTLQ